MAEGYVPPIIDTENCISCNECVAINPNIFAYNDQGKAIIKDAQGGPYKDLVRSAEKCTAGVIKPGLPADRSQPDIEKWIKRAEKYNE
jgi:pyruvate-ferredoxin/flavodoxin oxidoreductase